MAAVRLSQAAYATALPGKHHHLGHVSQSRSTWAEGPAGGASACRLSPPPLSRLPLEPHCGGVEQLQGCLCASGRVGHLRVLEGEVVLQ